MTTPAQPDPPEHGQLLVYATEDGKLKLEVRLEGETAWLTQQHMADLFQTTKQNVGQHLKNVFEEGELSENSVVKNFFTTAADGKLYRTNHYNLDAIISVGYRVKSAVATRFHTWATQKLREFISPSTKIAAPGCTRRGDAVSFTRKPTIWLPGQSKPVPNPLARASTAWAAVPSAVAPGPSAPDRSCRTFPAAVRRHHPWAVAHPVPQSRPAAVRPARRVAARPLPVLPGATGTPARWCPENRGDAVSVASPIAGQAGKPLSR